MIKIVLIVFSLLISTFVYSQTINGVYVQYSFMGIENQNEIKLFEKAKNPKVYSYTYSKKKSIQKLLITQESSVDSIFTNLFGKKVLSSVQIISVPSETTYYKDFKNNIFLFESVIGDNEKSVKDNLLKYEWALIDEEKEIFGYTCKKATVSLNAGQTKQLVTAWYSEDIPISDGPYTYSGLPGLIIQLELGKLSLIRLEKLEILESEIDITLPKSNTTQKTYKEVFGNNRIRG